MGFYGRGFIRGVKRQSSDVPDIFWEFKKASGGSRGLPGDIRCVLEVFEAFLGIPKSLGHYGGFQERFPVVSRGMYSTRGDADDIFLDFLDLKL